MAKQKRNREYSTKEKLDYYSGRANNPKLSDRQRLFARQRLNALTNAQPSNAAKRCSQPVSILPATHAQNSAFNAGLGYGAAKAGARVPVKPENQPSFSDGYKRGKALGSK